MTSPPIAVASRDRENSFILARFLLLRLLALIYFMAFASMLPQMAGLLGSNGISPAAEFLGQIGAQVGGERFFLFPTLAWLSSSDQALNTICVAGLIISLVAVFGILIGPCLFACWILYLSIVTIGAEFLSYQWDILLLEAGFLAVFYAPWRLFSPPLQPGKNIAREPIPSVVLLWLLRWLLFRLMFMSGIVKLASGDPTWWSLTALCFHYETQPLPTPLAWLFHQLPVWFQQLSVLMTFAIEIFVPFMIFGPRKLRLFAAAALITLQVLILLTGNYTFFNWLTIVLCLSLIDDACLLRLFPKRLADQLFNIEAPRAPGKGERLRRLGAIVCVVILIGLSTSELLIRLGVRAAVPYVARYMVALADPYHIVNSYGLFAVMTTQRTEIIVEGSNDGKEWKAYEFPFKPGDLKRAPPFVAPYQPRLDWQMWFAALGTYADNPWFLRFAVRLLEGTPEVLALLSHNPFPEKPPRLIRARAYDYHFTDWQALSRTGAWWRRSDEREYLPAMGVERTEP